MSLDILHYLLRFLNPHDLCKINQCSHLWRTLTDQEVIWKPLAINRWEIELKQDPIEMEIQLKHKQQNEDESNIKIWKNIYKSKCLQYKKYEKLIDQVSLNLFERLRTSYSVESGEYIWEKLDTISSIRSKPIHNGSNPQSTDTKADPSPVEIWKGIPANEYYARQPFTHVTVYLTKILFGVPYADVIKIVEHVEERHQWDQQLLQGWTLKRLDRRTDIIYLLFESMELLLLRQRHERVRTDGRRVSVFGQITPKEDELDEDIKQAVNDNRKSYFDDDDIDGLTRIKEQQGSGWCVEEIDPAQNTVRVSYQLRVPLDKPWETNVLFMAQATARAACLPGLEDYYHSKYIHQKTCRANSNQK